MGFPATPASGVKQISGFTALLVVPKASVAKALGTNSCPPHYLDPRSPAQVAAPSGGMQGNQYGYVPRSGP